MAFTTSCNTRRRATLAATALAVALLGMETASAAPQTAPFQLAPGHASRPAFYFLVATTGLVSVRVETPMDEPVSVALYAGSTALHHEQGRGLIAFSVQATSERLAAGREWAVIVAGSRPGTVGRGTITVDAPGNLARPSHPLDAWLQRRPAVAFHLTWNDGARTLSYSAWPPACETGFGAPSRRHAPAVPRQSPIHRRMHGHAPPMTIRVFRAF